MKEFTFVRGPAAVLFALLLGAAAPLHGADIDVVTSVIPTPPVQLCHDKVTLHFSITLNANINADFFQILPPGCTLLPTDITGLCVGNLVNPVISVSGSGSTAVTKITYNLSHTMYNLVTCDIDAVIGVPCGEPELLTINYAPDTGFGTLNAPSYSFVAARAKMLIDHFVTGVNTPYPGHSIPNVPAQGLNLGPDQGREFDIYPSLGVVDGFTFIYTPAPELHLTSLVFQRWHGSTTVPMTAPAPVPVGNSLKYVFTQSVLGNQPMGIGDRIHAIETFDVIQCSLPCGASALPVGGTTTYDVTWDCPEHPAVDHGCNHRPPVTRSALVQASPGGITADYKIENGANLVFCPPGTFSDLVLNFHNGTYGRSSTQPGQPGPLQNGSDLTPGSAKRRLHSISYQVKLEDLAGPAGFPLNQIYLEGSTIQILGGTASFDNSVNPTLVTGTGTSFSSDFNLGDDVYWADGTLLGKYQSGTATSMTLMPGTSGNARKGAYGKRGLTAQFPVMNIPGFYNYSPITHMVTLDFNVLSINNGQTALSRQPLGINGPLENEYMPEGTILNAINSADTLQPNSDVYNGFREGATISIRYSGATFYCQSRPAGANPVYNPFYGNATSPGGYAFGDNPQPTPEFLLFGDGTTLFDIESDDMCGCPKHEAPDGNLHNHTEVSTLATSAVSNRPGSIDIMPYTGGNDEVGTLDFRFVSPGYPTFPGPPSPFLFSGLMSGTPYFNCSTVNYRVLLTVPRYGATDGSGAPASLYCVQEANYYPDPNNATEFYTFCNTCVGLNASVPPHPFLPLPAKMAIPNADVLIPVGDDSYKFEGPFIGFNGELTVKVVLCGCAYAVTPHLGGVDFFTAKVQAICDSCVDCAYTTAFMKIPLDHHCNALCDNPNSSSTVQQQTTSFSFQRSTIGWNPTGYDPYNPVLVPATGPINRTLTYECDQITVDAAGSIAAGPLNVLAFRLAYDAPASAGNYQFFEYFGSGTLTLNGTADTYTINPATDLATTFNSVGNSWDGNTTAHKTLYVNLKDTPTGTPNKQFVDHVKSTGGTLTLHMVIKVKPMNVTGDPPPGAYILTPVQGQFMATDRNGVESECCDPYAADMEVLNVQTYEHFQILPGSYENIDFGWPLATGVCDTRFILRTYTLGGAPGFDEFVNEIRPAVKWRPGAAPLSMTLPAGVTLNDAQFFVVGRPGQVGAFNNTVSTTPAGAGNSGLIKFDSFQMGGAGPALTWPLFDRDAFSTDMAIRGSLFNKCPASTNNPHGCPPTGAAHHIPDSTLVFDYTSQFYSPAAPNGCNLLHDHPGGISLSYPEADFAISLGANPSLYVITGSPFSIGGLQYALFGWANSALGDPWIRITSPGIVRPGSDGILQTRPHVGSDDVIAGGTIVPAVSGGLLQTPSAAAGSDDVYTGGPNGTITAGPDGILQTTPVGTDKILGGMITSGCDGTLQTTYLDMPAGSDDDFGTTIVPGPDGILQTRPHPGSDDVITGGTIKPANTGGTLLTAAVAAGSDDVLTGGVNGTITAGPDGILQTTPVGTDKIVGGMITAGQNGVLQTTPAEIPFGSDDLIAFPKLSVGKITVNGGAYSVSPDGNGVIVPACGGTLLTTAVAAGSDDVLTPGVKVTAGPDGILQTTPVGTDKIVGGYFHLQSIPSDWANAANITLNDLTFCNCQPLAPMDVHVEYGFNCSRSDDPTNCMGQTFDFLVMLEKSGLAAGVCPPKAISGAQCSSYIYQVRMTSTDLGTVLDPTFALTVPAGMQITSATYEKPDLDASGNFQYDNSGCVKVNSGILDLWDPIYTSGASLIYPPGPLSGAYTFKWDIARSVFGGTDIGIPPTGIPPALGYVDLFFTITGPCGGNPSFILDPKGKDLCLVDLPVGPGPVYCSPCEQDLHLGPPQYPYSTALLLTPGVAPTINCAGPLTIQCPATPTFTAPTVTPGCDLNPGLSFTTGPQVPGTAPVCYTVTRTWTVTDTCGQHAQCSQTITVEDHIAPVIVATGTTLTLGCNPTAADINAALGTATATDNCSVGAPTFVDSAPINVSGCTWSQTRTWHVSDNCGSPGNPALPVTRTVTWTVATAPVFDNCTTGTTALGANPANIPTCDPLVIAHNECGSVAVTCVAGADTGAGCNHIQTLTYTATACNLTTTCARTYTWTVNCSTNCCDACTTNNYVSYTVHIQAHTNYYLAINLCHGTNNLLSNILPNVPNLTKVFKWDTASQSYLTSTRSGFGWSPNYALNLGQGFILNSPVTFDLTFSGCEPTNCPLPCLPSTNGCVLVGRFGIGTATWTNLSSCPPECGTRLSLWNGTGYDAYDYINGAWTPHEPVLGIGQSAFICLIDNTNCCCKGCVTNADGQYPVSYTVTVNPGLNFLVNPLCRGESNLIDDVLSNLPNGVPDNSVLYNWNKATQSYEASTYTAGLGWDPPMTLPPGQGFILNNPDPFPYDLTFQGCEPTCPPPCAPTNGFWLVGRIGTGNPTYYSNLFSCPPACGTEMSVWNGSSYDIYDYVNGVWTPPEQGLSVGQSVFVTVRRNTNCCVPVPAGLALWLPLDESSGVVSANLAQGGNNGTHVNGPAVNSGFVVRSLCFDGSSQYVRVPYYQAIDMNTNDFSIDAWVKRGLNDNGTRQIVNHLDVLAPRGYQLYLNNGQLTFAMDDFNNNIVAQSGQTVPADGNWHFVAVTVPRQSFNGGRLYMDATTPVPFDPIPASGSLANNSSVLVAVGDFDPIGLEYYFKGCIDEVEIFRRALTASEIQNIYAAGSVGKCRPPCETNINCASDKTVPCGIPWQFDPPTISGGCCSNLTVTLLSSNLTSDIPCRNAFTGVWRAMDCSSNIITCTQTVTVVDTTAPIITHCPTNRTLQANLQCSALVPDMTGEVAATDNCSIVSVFQTPVPNSNFGPGIHEVVFKVCDACSNCVTCTNFLTVPCPGALTLNCPTNILICTNNDGCGPMPKVAAYITASSLCGPVTINQSVVANATVCAATGPFSVLITLSDPCGNVTNCTVPLSFDRCCVEPPANMVLWLTFDETVGTVANNSQGGNNGTLYNDPAVATSGNGPVHTTSGYVARSLSFDGNNDVVRVPSYSSINVGSQDFTVDAWVYPSNNNVNGVIVQKIEYGSVQRGWSLELHGNYLYLNLDVPGFGQTLCWGVCPGALLTANKWQHVAVSVCRGVTNGGRFYIDGQAVGTFNPLPWAGSLSSSAPLAVGGPSVSASGDPYFKGAIDEVEVFCRCLSSNEVRSLWQAQQKGKCKLDCSLPWAKTFWFQSSTVQVQGYIHNPSPIAQTCTYSLSWLPIDGVNCTAGGIGSTGFSPASGTVTVPAGGTLGLPITITKPAGMHPGQCACYQIVIQPQGSKERFVCQGSVCAAAKLNLCVIVVNGGNSTNGTFTWSTNLANTATWSITNADVATYTGNYQLTAYGPDMLVDNGIMFTSPASGALTVSPNTATNLAVAYYYSDCDYYHFKHLVLTLDGLPVDSVVVGQGIPPEVALLPQLNVALTGGMLCFSWSGQAVLETTTSLSPPIAWTQAANQTNSQCIVPAGGQKFFRLRSP